MASEKYDWPASKLKIDMHCRYHSGKPLTRYCRNHRSFCCYLCAFTEHDKCGKLIQLNDLAQASAQNKLLEKQIAAFVETRKTVQTAIDEKSSCLRSLDKDKLSIRTKALNIAKEAKDKIDQLYTDFERNLTHEHEQVKKSQEQSMELLEDFRKKIEKNTSTMQLLSDVSPDESLIVLNKLKTETVKHHEKMERKLNQHTNERITFQIDATMESICNNLLLIGDVTRKSYAVNATADISPIKNLVDPEMMIGNPALKADVKLVKVVTLRDLGLRRGQYNPWFTDGKFIKDGHLLLIDYKNNRLVLLNEEMKVEREITVNRSPSCLDLSDDQKVVHVVCNNDSVSHYSIQEGKEVGRSMKVENEAGGLRVRGDTTLIGRGFFGSSPKIVIYDAKGNNIKSATHSIVHYPYIAVSNSGDQFYCKSGDTVLACDRDLNQKWRYESGDLKVPHGICVDHYDNVYVVGGDSRNLHQISHHGTRHRVLVQQMDKIHRPLAIAFNESKDEFVVTSEHEDVAFEMYKFSP